MEKKRASEQSNKRYNRDHVRWNSDNQKSIKPPYFFSMCKVSSGCFVFSYGLLVALRSRCLFGILLHSFLERLLFDFYLLSFLPQARVSSRSGYVCIASFRRVRDILSTSWTWLNVYALRVRDRHTNVLTTFLPFT